MVYTGTFGVINNVSYFVNLAKASLENGSNIIFCAIDIHDVRYINSSGIGVLITILTKFRNKGGEVVLIKPSDSVEKLLVITKLNSIFTIVPNLDHAFSELVKS